MKFVLREINPKLSPINLKGLLSNRLVHKSEITGLIIMNNKIVLIFPFYYITFTITTKLVWRLMIVDFVQKLPRN